MHLSTIIQNQRSNLLRFIRGLNAPSKAGNLRAFQQRGEQLSAFKIRPTCKFYEAMGGEKLYGRNGGFHGGYAFNNLAALNKHL